MNTIDILATWQKQPSDTQDYDVSFVRWLARLKDTPAAVTPVVVIAEPGITLVSFALVDGVVKVWLSGGLDGETYKITVRMTTTGGRVKEVEFQIEVKEV